MFRRMQLVKQLGVQYQQVTQGEIAVSRGRHVLIFSLCFVFGLANSIPVIAAEASPELSKINARLMTLMQRATRLNTSMSQAIKSTTTAPIGSGMVDSTLDLIATAPGGINVDVVTRGITEANKHKLQLPGVHVQHVSKKYQRATVSVDSTDALYALASLPEVVSIAPMYKPLTMTGSVNSRAVQALRVDTAKLNFDATTPDMNLDGSGQKIGVLSDSFAQTAAVRDGDTNPAAGTLVPAVLTGTQPQDSGDLPPTIDLRRDNGDPTFVIDEGAAMAELIHDLAPGAGIAFHTAEFGQAVFADGIDDLCAAAGAASTVLVDDIIYLAEPMYQDGIIAQAAANCVASGVPFFSSAGNNSNRGFRQSFVDINPQIDDVSNPGAAIPTLPTGVDLHDWGGGDGYLDITIPAGASISVVVQWNQPFQSLNAGSGAQVDLDVYLATSPNPAGIQTGFAANLFSADNQGNTGAPLGDALELVGVTNNGGAAGTLYLAIEHRNGSQGAIPQDANTPLEFRIVIFESGGRSTIQGINDATSAFGGPTIYGHAVAAGVTSVAAVPWFETAAYRPDLGRTPVTDPESFTARGGPTAIHFDPAGNFAPRSSYEPDIAAVDGNNTTFFGGIAGTTVDGEEDGIPNFFGTSAAAPNAAAVAALIKEYLPTLTVNQINTLMANTAVDITGYRAAPGVDDVTGPGLIDLNAALAAPNASPIADAGADFTALPGTEITLGGASSGVEFQWAEVSTTPQAVLVRGGDSPKATYFLPTASATSTLTFRVTASNPFLAQSVSDEVVVTVDAVPVVVPPPVTGGGGGGGCSVSPKQAFDPLFAGLLLLAGLYRLRRRTTCH